MTSNPRTAQTDRQSVVEAVSALTVWVMTVALFLWLFNRLTPVVFYCLSYPGFLLIVQWAFSRQPGTRLRRALVLTVALASIGFLLAITVRILELLPEISQYF